MIKVAILDDYQNAFEHIIETDKYKNKYDFQIFQEPFLNEAEAAVALEKFDAVLLMRERTPVTSSLIESLPNLKYVMTSGMRNKAIDLDAAKSRNILVCGTEINPNPTAELAWALILGLARNIKQEVDNMFQGYWQTSIGLELKGKMLGLIGLGKIGTQMATIGKAFGMQVSAWSENLDLTHANKLGVLPMSKEDLLSNSDFISIHIVLRESYKNLITSKEFKLMKKSAFLINTSRGPIINELDLIKALDDEAIAGAGLDVYDKEPLPVDHILRKTQNTILTPHIGYVSVEAYDKFFNGYLKAIEAFLNEKPINLIT